MAYFFQYLDSIKTYFNTIDNEGEIIKDFELRIAENFSSKTSDFKKYFNKIKSKNLQIKIKEFCSCYRNWNFI